MIKTEYYGENGLGSKLYRTYSDEKKYIKQVETNIVYSEAIDVADENGNITNLISVLRFTWKSGSFLVYYNYKKNIIIKE